MRLTRDEFQRNTVLQIGSGTWLEIRCNLITSSRFHDVYKKRFATRSSSLVMDIIYKCNVVPIQYGKKLWSTTTLFVKTIQIHIHKGKLIGDIAEMKKEIILYKWNPFKELFDINHIGKCFYKMRGQLKVTGRKSCKFGVWIGFVVAIAFVRRRKDFLAKFMEQPFK